MIKITKAECEMLEDDGEMLRKLMSDIETKLDQVENGEYDADKGEIEAIKAQLESEYSKLEKKNDELASYLRHSFVAEGPMHDDASMDYQITEMKALI